MIDSLPAASGVGSCQTEPIIRASVQFCHFVKSLWARIKFEKVGRYQTIVPTIPMEEEIRDFRSIVAVWCPTQTYRVLRLRGDQRRSRGVGLGWVGSKTHRSRHVAFDMLIKTSDPVERMRASKIIFNCQSYSIIKAFYCDVHWKESMLFQKGF